MKKPSKYIILTVAILLFNLTSAQERIISGKVIGQELIEFPGVLVMTSDSKVLDTTDFSGNFSFKYSEEIKKIKFVFPMLQQEEVNLTDNCDHIEVILPDEWIYDFVSLKKAERKKKRDRKRILPKLYAEAYDKGIFKNEKSCR